MRTALITTEAPDPFIEMDAAKQHLRVDSADEDDLIGAMIAAICGHLDGPDGITKFALGEQTLKLLLPSFHAGAHRHRAHDYVLHRYPRGKLELPLPPARAVTEITYFDSSNTQQTLTGADYSLILCGTAPSLLLPATSWPPTYSRPDAVSITFTAGFDDEDGDNPVPPAIIAVAKMMLTNLYENRASSSFTPGLTVAAENPAVKALLSPWRILKM